MKYNKLFSLAIAFCLVALVIAPLYADQSGRGIAQPQRLYDYVRNISGATINAGQIVNWATATTVGYGYDITQIAAASTSLVAGVAVDDIQHNEYGLIQNAGYHSAVYVNVSNNDIAVGDILIPAGGRGFLVSNNTVGEGSFTALESHVVVHDDIRHEKDNASPPTVKTMIRLR